MRMLRFDAYEVVQSHGWDDGRRRNVLSQSLKPTKVWFSSNHTFRLDRFPREEDWSRGEINLPDGLKGDVLLRLTVDSRYPDSDGFVITEKEARRVFDFR